MSSISSSTPGTNSTDPTVINDIEGQELKSQEERSQNEQSQEENKHELDEIEPPQGDESEAEDEDDHQEAELCACYVSDSEKTKGHNECRLSDLYWADVPDEEPALLECCQCAIKKGTCAFCHQYLCGNCRSAAECGVDIGIDYDPSIKVVPCGKCKKMVCYDSCQQAPHMQGCAQDCSCCRLQLCPSCAVEWSICEKCGDEWTQTVDAITRGSYVPFLCQPCLRKGGAFDCEHAAEEKAKRRKLSHSSSSD